MVNTSALALTAALIASFGALLYKPIVTRVELFGIGRSFKGFDSVHGEGLKFFPDTYGCEDLHYHEPANVIFGVAEEKQGSRYEWFPPLAKFNDSNGLGQGFFFMVLPDEDKIIRLQFTDLTGPFITHGFDIWADPQDKETLYFIAINHLPNPAHSALQGSPDVPRARSQIEIFQHTLGTLDVRHRRSLRHPLIRTPNDIYAVDADHFFVTNDHRHRDGGRRFLEDLGHEDFGAESDIIHVAITDPTSTNPSAGFTATIALDNQQNPNGLGHGRHSDEIFLGRAAGGIIHLAHPLPAPNTNQLNLTDKLQLPQCVDNPSWFHDPYAVETGRDASGLVVAGLTYAFSFPEAPANPVAVWLFHPQSPASSSAAAAASPMQDWQSRIIFKDDGQIMNSASIGVLVAIPPQNNEGRKQAWLYVAGPMAEGIVKTKVDL